MKTQINFSTYSADVGRFPTREQLVAHLQGFDGIELMWWGDHELVTPDLVVGVHLNCRFS